MKLDDGRVYYYHRLTRASRWDKPEGAVADAMEQRIQDQERQKQAAVEERRRKREVEKQAKDEEAKARDNFTHSVGEEVKAWAEGKSIHQLLNELDVVFEGAPTPNLLTANSSASEIKRAYLKAIRFCHPDKIGRDATMKRKLLSQAVFGAVNAAYERRKRVENM